MSKPLGWAGIVRLGLVQACLGAIVVITTSTMNRVMVVELGLPALVPGALVALHYGIQVARPRLGYGSDRGMRRTPWILGGMALLVCGGFGAALATCWMASDATAGIILGIAAFAMVGLGVGGCGTALLVLLSNRVAPTRRAAAASVVWIMMIAGIAVTATVAGRVLDPFSPRRLLTVTAAVCGIAMLVTLLAVWRVEGVPSPIAVRIQMPFRQALAQIWADAQARRFTLFVFVSMFAYSAQELILEPCLGVVFHLTPGESTALTGLQHGGVLVGMVLVAVATGAFAGGRLGSPRFWTVGGCLCSALAILGLAVSAWTAAAWAVHPALFTLGVTNGVFAVSAIGAMMGLAHAGNASGAGTRMGLWGAAQALAFGLGGLTGTSATDLARFVFGAPDIAYAAVLVGEAALFMIAAAQAMRAFDLGATRARGPSPLTLGPAPWPHGG